jgi:hypothetical protein
LVLKGMKVLISSLVVLATVTVIFGCDLVHLSQPALGSCDPPPEQPKNPPKK